ncbi:melanocortin receptor 5-like [Styela clava]
MLTKMPLIISMSDEEGSADYVTDGLEINGSELSTTSYGLSFKEEVNTTTEAYFLTSTMYTTSCVNNCDVKQFRISYSIITLGVIALIENLLLLFVVASLKLGKKCKMFYFLWHFSLADVILAFNYVLYNGRTISVCPTIYTCERRFFWETYSLQAMFTTSLLASYFFVLAATIDTFIAVRCPLWYTSWVTTKRVRIISVVIWTFTLSVASTGIAMMIWWDRRKGHSVLTFLLAILCVITAATVIGFNVAIVVSAWITINKGINKEAENRQSQFRSENLNTISRTLSSRSRISIGSIQLSERQKQNRKLTVTLVMFVAAFLTSCVPWPATLLICPSVGACQIKSYNVYILVLVLVHTVIIPIIYGFRIEEVNQEIKKLFRAVVNFIKCGR